MHSLPKQTNVITELEERIKANSKEFETLRELFENSSSKQVKSYLEACMDGVLEEGNVLKEYLDFAKKVEKEINQMNSYYMPYSSKESLATRKALEELNQRIFGDEKHETNK